MLALREILKVKMPRKLKAREITQLHQAFQQEAGKRENCRCKQGGDPEWMYKGKACEADGTAVLAACLILGSGQSGNN